MEKSNRFLPHLLILVVGLFIFLPGIFSFFNSDDFIWIKNSQKIDIKTIYDFALDYNSVIKFRPLVHFFFQLLYGIFGLTPLGYHLMGLIFHLLNAVIFYNLLLKFTSDNKLSLISSLIFISHFAHEETLFWISAISSPMVIFFYLCCICSLWRYLTNKETVFYLLSFLLSVLALLTKEDGITIFIVVFLMSYFKTTGDYKLKFKKGMKLSAPFLGLTILYSVIRYLTVPEYIMSRFITYNPLVIIKNICYFGISLLFPVRLFFDLVGFEVHSYLNNLIQHRLYNIGVIIVLLLISCVFLWAIFSLLKKEIYGFKLGLCVLFLGVLPYLLVNGNGQRFLYFSSLGFSIALASLILYLSNRFKGVNIVNLLIVLILICNGVILYERSTWWRKAGKVCEETINEAGEIISSYPDGAEVYFVNLPMRMNGAYTFHTGFESALPLFYPEAKVKVYDLGQLECDKLKDLKNSIKEDVFIYKAKRFMRLQ